MTLTSILTYFVLFCRFPLCPDPNTKLATSITSHFSGHGEHARTIPISTTATTISKGRAPADLAIKYIGDYCDVYLTHDSMSVRKAHNSGRNHLRNVIDYYQRTSRALDAPKELCRTELTQPKLEIGQEKAQSVIDSITSSYAAEGQPVPNPAMVPPGAFPPPLGFPGTFPLPFNIIPIIK